MSATRLLPSTLVQDGTRRDEGPQVEVLVS